MVTRLSRVLRSGRPAPIPVGLSSLLALLAVPVLAGADPDSAPVELPTVEVVEDPVDPPPEPTVAEDPTGFGTVIGREEFEHRHVRAGDVLVRAPGTTVRHNPGGETLHVRGTSPEHTLVFLDGIRLNPASGGGVDLRTVPPAFLERLTLLRGNEGARYGAGAFGGVALLETRTPEPGETRATAGVTAGSFGTYALDGSVAGGGETYDGLAALSLYRTAGDYRAPYDPTPSLDDGDVVDRRVENNDDRHAALLLKGGARWGGLHLTALAHGILAERGIPGTFYRPTPDRRRYDRRLLAAVRGSGEPAADLVLAGGLEFRRDQLRIDDGGATGVDANLVPGDDAWQTEHRALASAGLEATPYDWALVRLDAEAGGEWLEGPYHGDRSRPLLAGAASAELYLGQRLTVAPAARFDRVGDHDAVSPKLGVAYRPLPFLELRANGARTFRPPSFGELYLDQGPMKPNPDLDPEHGWAVDGGAVVRIGPVEFQGSGFYGRSEDLIVYELVSGTVTKPLNFADAEVVGGEVEAIVRPLSGLTLSASWAHATSRNLRDDPRYLEKDLPYHPRDRYQARADYRRGGLSGFVEGAHQSAQFTNRENTSSLPAQTTVNAGAGVRVARAPWAVWLSGQVDNLLDAVRVDQLGFPQPGRAFFAVLRAGPPEADDGAGDSASHQ
jgi:vitamin B12 transporter